jgi:endonuclease/exonuclease/phosphatase (EEP) superfamily protein YafD
VPPSSRSSALERNQQLKGIGEFIAEHDQPVVLIGDLNATPWNRFYKRLKHDSGMTDSARGFGLQPT